MVSKATPGMLQPHLIEDGELEYLVFTLNVQVSTLFNLTSYKFKSYKDSKDYYLFFEFNEQYYLYEFSQFVANNEALIFSQPKKIAEEKQGVVCSVASLVNVLNTSIRSFLLGAALNKNLLNFWLLHELQTAKIV